MKLLNIHFSTKAALTVLLAYSLLTGCNKELPEAEPIVHGPVNSETATLADILSAEASLSMYKAAITKAGLMPRLSDTTRVYTVYAPSNAAFIASGIPSEAAIEALPTAMVAGMMQYTLIPGQQYLAAGVPEQFPNIQLPSALSLGNLPGTPLTLQMSLFPSRRGNGQWLNNIPVTAVDKKARNGVIHQTAAVVAPPSTLLKQSIYANPNLSFFKAGVARADSGAVGLQRLDSLLGYAATNMTVLVPNNEALQTLLFGSIYSHLLQQGVPAPVAQAQASGLVATPAVFENPLLFSVLTAQTVKGILAYHFLATDKGQGYQPNIRVFSNNFSATPSFHTTLVNSSVAIHPGILVAPTFTGPMVSKITFTGLGTFPPGGAPFTGAAATAVSKDNHCVNGVYYVIDKVLLPQ